MLWVMCIFRAPMVCPTLRQDYFTRTPNVLTSNSLYLLYISEMTTLGSMEEQALDYTLGELTPDAAIDYEVSLTEASDELALVSNGLTAFYASAADGMPTPRREMKESILMAVANDGHYLQRGDDNLWLKTLIPGITVRRLYKDADGRDMVIARLEPGSILPGHDHPQTEECYVISGDIHVAGHDLIAGDFIAARVGTIHEDVYTKGGCEILQKFFLDESLLA